MGCHRCRGLMVVDYFIDMNDDQGHLWLCAWRCVNCGEVERPRTLQGGERLATSPSRTEELVHLGV